MTTLYIILAIIVVIIFWIIALYNGLIRLRNRTKEGWSDIDVQLKRRHDLIPNLINSVKGYMKYEGELLEKVTQLRSQAMEAKDKNNIPELNKVENQLGGALGKLQIAVEAYPDLKANTNVAQLMDELSDTENKIQAARRFYNGQVRDFNTKIESFPNNFVAGILKFNKFDFFAVENKDERKVVEVKL